MVTLQRDITMPIDAELLSNIAINAADNAYAPYSGWHVGAVAQFVDLRTELIGYVTGSNVENASYGLTQCAERTAITRGIAEGYRTLQAVALATKDKHKNIVRSFFPCGACLQVIAEFGTPDTLIILAGIGEFPLRQLLPYSFRLDHSGNIP